MNKADLSNLMAHGKLKNYDLVCYLYYYNNRPNPKITCYGKNITLFTDSSCGGDQVYDIQYFLRTETRVIYLN